MPPDPQVGHQAHAERHQSQPVSDVSRSAMDPGFREITLFFKVGGQVQILKRHQEEVKPNMFYGAEPHSHTPSTPPPWRGPWDTWLHPILQAEAGAGVFGGLGCWVQGAGLAGLAAAGSPRKPGPGRGCCGTPCGDWELRPKAESFPRPRGDPRQGEPWPPRSPGWWGEGQ